MKIFIRSAFSMFAVTAIAMWTVAPLHGATQVWSGLSPFTNNWSDSVNWVSGVAPVPGDSLQFQGNLRTTNNNDFVTTFNSITFNSTAAAFTLQGNTVGLNSGITNNSVLLQTLDFTVVNIPPFQGIILNVSQTFNAFAGDLLIESNVEPFIGAVTLTITGAHNTFITGVVEDS